MSKRVPRTAISIIEEDLLRGKRKPGGTAAASGGGEVPSSIAHNATSGIQGGLFTERYHFQKAAHDQLADFWDAGVSTGSGAYMVRGYVSRLYLNATAYLDGAVAGYINITGNVNQGGQRYSIYHATNPYLTLATAASGADQAYWQYYSGQIAFSAMGANFITFRTTDSDTERMRITNAGAVNLATLTTATAAGQLGLNRLYLNATAILDGANAGRIGITGTLDSFTVTSSGTITMNTPTGVSTESAIIINKAGGYGQSIIQNFYVDGTHYGLAIGIGGTTTKWSLNIGGNVGMVAGAKLYLDGIAATGDTYIEEVSANNLRAVAGNSEAWRCISGQLKISAAYTMPTTDGSANQVLSTNGAGAATWRSISDGLGLYGTTLDSDATERSDFSGAWVVFHSVAITVSAARAMALCEYDAKGPGGGGITTKVVVATTAGGTTDVDDIQYLGGYWSNAGTLYGLTAGNQNPAAAYDTARALVNFSKIAIGTVLYVNFCGLGPDAGHVVWMKNTLVRVNP